MSPLLQAAQTHKPNAPVQLRFMEEPSAASVDLQKITCCLPGFIQEIWLHPGVYRSVQDGNISTNQLPGLEERPISLNKPGKILKLLSNRSCLLVIPAPLPLCIC